MSEQPQTISTLSSDPEATHYNGLVLEARQLCKVFPRSDIEKTLLFFEIEDLARNELKKIGEEIDKSVKSWNPDFYHRDVLLKPTHTPVPDTPDAFFGRYARTKSRLILRLTSKVVLSKVKKLLSAPPLVKLLISTFDNENVHRQIQDYIDRWDKNTRVVVPAPDVTGKGRRRKRQQEGTPPNTKRQQLEFSHQESLRQAEMLSAIHTSCLGDLQQEHINTAQSLPTITSLNPGPRLPTFLPYQNPPSLLAMHPVAQNGTVQTLEKQHEQARLRMPQEQHEELFGDIGHQWDYDNIDRYLFF